MKTTKILISVFSVSIVFFLFSMPYSAFAQTERFELPVGSSLQKGPANAPVTIIEFLDFQ